MMNCHTIAVRGQVMPTSKIAITLEEHLLEQIDRLVAQRQFPSRSRAVQEAVREKLARMDRNRFARECEKLNSRFERAMAEQGMGLEAESWPEY
jgi:metal-responsive CopG/Arc/MetJ family transcriptional regulator